MANDCITIKAVEKGTEKTIERTFACENEYMLKSMVEHWEINDVSFGNYKLITFDFIEDYTEEVKEMLDELKVAY